MLPALGEAGVSAEKHTSDGEETSSQETSEGRYFKTTEQGFFGWGDGLVRVSNQSRDI